MIYYKPKNLTYSQLCIWIDQNSHKDDCDEYTLYQYLYLVIDLLAKKNKYFRRYDDYEKFSIFAATRIFLRLRRSKSSAKQEINYILPYLKRSLNFIRIDYQKQEFTERYEQVESYEHLVSFNDLIYSMSDELSLVDFRCCLHDIGNTINAFFNQLPRNINSSELYNIKISVILSFLYQIKYGVEKAVIINLDYSYENLIIVLLRELKNTIAKDLNEIIGQMGIGAVYNIISNPNEDSSVDNE